MEAAFSMLAWSFLFGIVGGLISGYGYRMASARRCTRLEWAVGDLQERLSSMKGKVTAKARWDKADLENEQLAQLMQQPAARTKRYDNDPLGEL